MQARVAGKGAGSLPGAATAGRAWTGVPEQRRGLPPGPRWVWLQGPGAGSAHPNTPGGQQAGTGAG